MVLRGMRRSFKTDERIWSRWKRKTRQFAADHPCPQTLFANPPHLSRDIVWQWENVRWLTLTAGPMLAWCRPHQGKDSRIFLRQQCRFRWTRSTRTLLMVQVITRVLRTTPRITKSLVEEGRRQTSSANHLAKLKHQHPHRPFSMALGLAKMLSCRAQHSRGLMTALLLSTPKSLLCPKNHL